MAVFLSIVIPVYNEEESLQGMVSGVVDVLETLDTGFEVILVDDGSTDRSWEAIGRFTIDDHRIKGIRFRRNYGQTSAMVAGFDHACGEIIVTMDGDLQNDPTDIPLLLEKIGEGYDIVSGWRKERKDHFMRVFPSIIANRFISMTTGVNLHDYGCSLKAYRAECIRSVNAYGEMHRFFPALASMTGARVTEVVVTHHRRRFGCSKYGFDRIFKVFSDILAMNLIIRFSSMPLKGFALCAVPFLMLTLFFVVTGGGASFLRWSDGKALFFFFVAALNWMAAVHLVSLGILGELVVGTSDLEHTQLAEITRKKIKVGSDGTDKGQETEIHRHRASGRKG